MIDKTDVDSLANNKQKNETTRCHPCDR